MAEELTKRHSRKGSWDMCSIISSSGRPCPDSQLYLRGLCWRHLATTGEDELKRYVSEVTERIQIHDQIEGACLQRVDLSDQSLENAVFVCCNLREANFNGCNLTNAHFIECKLERATFIRTDLTSSRFVDCLISQANFSRASFKGCYLAGSNMSEVVMIRTDLSEGEFHQCELSSSKMFCSALHGTEFHMSYFLNARLDRARGRSVVFDDAEFTGASLVGAYLTEASFARCHLESTRMESACLRNANFSHAELADIHFEGADLSGAEFSSQALALAHIQGAILNDIHLDYVGLGVSDVVRNGPLVFGVRTLPPRIRASWWTWIAHYTTYCAVRRLQWTGVMRGYVYISSILVGGSLAFLLSALGVAPPALIFLIIFACWLLIYKFFIRKRVVSKRLTGLLYIVRSLSR